MLLLQPGVCYLSKTFTSTSAICRPFFVLLEHKKLHKVNLSFAVKSLKLMGQMFQKIQSLKIWSNRGRKHVTQNTPEEVAMSIADVSEDNFAVIFSIIGYLGISTGHIVKHAKSQEGLSTSILRKNWHMKELRLVNYDKRKLLLSVFVRMKMDVAWKQKTLCSDDTHFELNVYLNSQKVRIWDSSSQNSFKEFLLQSLKIALWCGATE